MKLSIVIPVYNEGEGVHAAYDGIRSAILSALPDCVLEMIFVDDGSRDDSFEHLQALAARHADVRVIKLLTNVGAHMAIRAGMDAATGDYACFTACDLQDPPSAIPAMLEKCVGNVQVVWAVRKSRAEGVLTQAFANIYHALAHAVVSRNLPPGGSSMMLVGTKALRALKANPERNLTIDGFFATAGFRMDTLAVERQERTRGTSKWTLGKKIKLIIDVFTAYSYVPIRAMSAVGVVLALLGLVYAAVIALRYLFLGVSVPGWTSLMIVILLIGGVQITMLGVLGEYVWRGLDESRRRPRYIVDEAIGFDAGNDGAKDQANV